MDSRLSTVRRPRGGHITPPRFIWSSIPSTRSSTRPATRTSSCFLPTAICHRCLFVCAPHNRTTSIYTNDVTSGELQVHRRRDDRRVAFRRGAAVRRRTRKRRGGRGSAAAGRALGSRGAGPQRSASATNVPLFAPRTFADLFRHLVEEVTENGYHFQKTAENVATRMTDTGRNVSRRQVVFVVKGLALKGHVSSHPTIPPTGLPRFFASRCSIWPRMPG